MNWAHSSKTLSWPTYSCLLLSFENGIKVVGVNSTKCWKLSQDLTKDTLGLQWLFLGTWDMNKIIHLLATLDTNG